RPRVPVNPALPATGPSYPLGAALVVLLFGFLFVLGWRGFLAVLDSVEGRVLFFGLWVAEEALRQGPIVLGAPVALLLELGGDLGTAHAALRLGNAVLVAPPTAVVVDFL